AVARGIDRRAARRGEIDALMHSAVAEDRMLARAEGRRQPGAVDRRAHQIGAQAFALGIKVFGFAVLRSMAPDAELAAAERDRGELKVATPHSLVVLVMD